MACKAGTTQVLSTTSRTSESGWSEQTFFQTTKNEFLNAALPAGRQDQDPAGDSRDLPASEETHSLCYNILSQLWIS
jgi:hypothetical protein